MAMDAGSREESDQEDAQPAIIFDMRHRRSALSASRITVSSEKSHLSAAAADIKHGEGVDFDDDDHHQLIMNLHKFRQPSLAAKLVAEFIDTYIVVLVALGSLLATERNDGIGLPLVIFSLSATVASLFYATAHVSGAHFNPAVTVGLAFGGLFPWIQVPYYVGAQLLGSILGSITLRWLFKGVGDIGAILSAPGGSTSDIEALACETIATSILMFVVYGAVVDRRSVKEVSGIVIAAILSALVTMTLTVSGASLNPARSIGPAVALWRFDKVWIYAVGPTVGSAVGSLLYSSLYLHHEAKNTVIDRLREKLSSAINNSSGESEGIDLATTV